MAGKVTGRCALPFFRGWRLWSGSLFPGFSGRRSRFLFHRRLGSRLRLRRLDLGENLVEEGGTRGSLLLSTFAAMVSVLGIARLADHLHHLSVHHAGNSVVQKHAATRAVIVNQITEAWWVVAHVDIPAREVATRETADYSAPAAKINSALNGLPCPLWLKRFAAGCPAETVTPPVAGA